MCVCVCVCVLSCFSHVQLFATLWTIARQVPLSMGFSRQEYWSGLPCPPPGDLPNPGIEPESPMSLALTGGFFTTNATWESQDTTTVAQIRVCEDLSSASSCFAAEETTDQSWIEWGRERNLPWPPFFAFREWVDVGAIYLVGTWIGSQSPFKHRSVQSSASWSLCCSDFLAACIPYVSSFSQLDILSSGLESIREAESPPGGRSRWPTGSAGCQLWQQATPASGVRSSLVNQS